MEQGRCTVQHGARTICASYWNDKLATVTIQSSTRCSVQSGMDDLRRKEPGFPDRHLVVFKTKTCDGGEFLYKYLPLVL
jgi:hypothetical protein